MIITAPDPYFNLEISNLFIAGGISNCPDWQMNTCHRFEEFFSSSLIINNPRRNEFDVNEEPEIQIKWEFDRLRLSKFLFFWFPEETLCPITLLEYGKYVLASNNNDNVYVGCHRNYQRKNDILIQSKLQFNHVKIYYDLDSLVEYAIEDITNKL